MRFMFWHRIESNCKCSFSIFFMIPAWIYVFSLYHVILLYGVCDNRNWILCNIVAWHWFNKRCAHRNPTNISITTALWESWHSRINFARLRSLCARYWVPRFFPIFFLPPFTMCMKQNPLFEHQMWNIIISMVLSIFGTFYCNELLFVIKQCATSSINGKKYVLIPTSCVYQLLRKNSRIMSLQLTYNVVMILSTNHFSENQMQWHHCCLGVDCKVLLST